MAVNYISEVQTVYAQQPQVYRRFLDIMHDARNRGLGVQAVVATIDAITQLFGLFAHPDLIRRFDNFLPPRMRLIIEENEPEREFGGRLAFVVVSSQAADEVFEIAVPPAGPPLPSTNQASLVAVNWG
ncbi:hypothetical protein FRB90_012032 [Tulasnella sp. 427]|nr:hypothetical protein FRB90_012032 [Tulasnella sp. 427]